MSVTVITGPNKAFNISVCDIKDGHAYESEHGYIFIGNECAGVDSRSIKAFSICGTVIAVNTSGTKYREVSLIIEVLPL